MLRGGAAPREEPGRLSPRVRRIAIVARMKASDLPLHYNAVDVLERNLPERAEKTAIYSADREVTYGALAAEVNRFGKPWVRKFAICPQIVSLNLMKPNRPTGEKRD